MSEPTLKYLEMPTLAAAGGGARRLAYWDWAGASTLDASHAVVCVHGLSRQGRDFDTLARALAGRVRVLSVDVAGRGHSDWLADPMGYQIPQYGADIATLLQHVRAQEGVSTIDWVGTSMGGLIGLGLAAQAAMGLRRLVLNDVGPAVRWEALQRIGTYLGLDPVFDSAEAAIDYLGSISLGFGPHTPEQWRALNLPMLRCDGDRWRLHYDPAIAVPYRALMGLDEAQGRAAAAAGEAALWGLYDNLRLPTLLLRGATSDLLSAETARDMGMRGPCARLVTFDGVGHAPTLVAPDQVETVRRFLLDMP
ncbi:alpha/beta fold hydrolase [Hydrogenophaga sp. OTU3427]|uniref:alpha/beta fold hydrolase n=1 Tax=Hydrogenophaga sp. OTU3427 TaxID=3043856 RepID=UPI00313DFB39